MLAIGGYGLSSMLALDVKSRTTKLVAPLIGGVRWWANAAASETEVVVVGGHDENGNGLNSAEMYDLATDT